MITRCEYCGQLYEGLSCPHCCAPRGESEEDECVGPGYDSMTFSDFSEILDGIKETCDPEWILTNSSCVGNNNVQVIGDNNTVNGFYADNVLYWVDHDVCLDDQPSERGESTTDAYDEDELEKVDDTHHAEKRCNKDEASQDVLLAVITWLGVCSMSMIIGMPIIPSIGIATGFCGILFGLMNINNCDD